MKITVNYDKKYQAFQGFGASGAWWAQLVGGWESTEDDGTLKKDKIAALLYSKNSGIGLKTYRYNLGTDSAFSGKGIYSDGARRTESFDNPPAGR